VVWFDEEVPMDIYMEGLTRLLTTCGIMMLTFTPLNGLTEVVLRFLPAGL
jgi:phage terminase large subunit-like protein